jgi:hypothetical protein
MFGSGNNIGRTPAPANGRAQSSGLGRTTKSGSLFNPTDFSLNIGGQVRAADPSGSGSTLVGNGFIGRSDESADFVGRRAQNGAGTGNTLGNGAIRRNLGQGRGGNGQNRQRQFNNQNGNNQLNGNNGNNNRQQQGTRSQPKRMVTRHRVDFATSPVPETAVESKLETRFHGMISDRMSAKDLKFQVDADGVLVMHGEVDNAHDKALAALIASMEPGVRGVRNELDVTAPPTQPATEPAESK